MSALQNGYYAYYAGGSRGDCRHPLTSMEYLDWHLGFDLAEEEDK